MKLASVAVVAIALLATPVWAADAPKPVVLSATAEELQALDNLLDLATKSGGLAVANNALAWHNKLVQAVAPRRRRCGRPWACFRNSAPRTAM